MKAKSAIILTSLLTMLLLISCETDALLDLPGHSDQFIIVEANVDDLYGIQKVRLYRSSSFYDTIKGYPVSNAYVLVSDGIQSYVFDEDPWDLMKGFYNNHVIGENLRQGIIYHLTISDGSGSYTARSELRPVPAIDSVTISLNVLCTIGIVTQKIYDVFIHFNNLGGLNYYLINLYVNDKLITTTPAQKTVVCDRGMDGHVSVFGGMIRKTALTDGDLVTAELKSISRQKYEFYTSFFNQTELSGNPFAGAPPANIPTNMSRGALGFFQVSSVSKASVRIKTALL
jgi:hypothetical protein